MNNSEKFLCNSSFACEVSTTVNLQRLEDVDMRLLITTYADNNHLFDGKATKKDKLAKIAEQYAISELLLASFSKRVLVLILSYENEFICTETRFEKEAKSNWKWHV